MLKYDDIKDAYIDGDKMYTNDQIIDAEQALINSGRNKNSITLIDISNFLTMKDGKKMLKFDPTTKMYINIKTLKQYTMIQYKDAIEKIKKYANVQNISENMWENEIIGIMDGTLILNKPILDSGERRKFSTGAVRDVAENKGCPALISPIFIDKLSKHLEKGAKKYAARNWEKGMPLYEILNSLLRHIFKELFGMVDEDHDAAMACNIMFYIHTKEKIKQGKLSKELLKNMPQEFMENFNG